MFLSHPSPWCLEFVFAIRTCQLPGCKSVGGTCRTEQPVMGTEVATFYIFSAAETNTPTRILWSSAETNTPTRILWSSLLLESQVRTISLLSRFACGEQRYRTCSGAIPAWSQWHHMWRRVSVTRKDTIPHWNYAKSRTNELYFHMIEKLACRGQNICPLTPLSYTHAGARTHTHNLSRSLSIGRQKDGQIDR